MTVGSPATIDRADPISAEPGEGAAAGGVDSRTASGRPDAIVARLERLPFTRFHLHMASVLGVGTFFAQAIATGFVGRAATADRGSASGIYLTSYFTGGLVGSAVLGRAYELFDWGGCVAGIGAALATAALLGLRLRMPAPTPVLAATG